MNQELQELAWRRNHDALQQYKSIITGDVMQRALDLSLKKNTPKRFTVASLPANDKIIEQSSMFDQMKGWNDCINYLLNLSLPQESQVIDSTTEQYPDDYVKEITEKHYTP